MTDDLSRNESSGTLEMNQAPRKSWEREGSVHAGTKAHTEEGWDNAQSLGKGILRGYCLGRKQKKHGVDQTHDYGV